MISGRGGAWSVVGRGAVGAAAWGSGGTRKVAMAKRYDSVECPFCDEVTKYEKLAKISQGTFGEVFKAKHRQTDQKVALKKVLMESEKEGFPITALWEIKILQLLKHENVVNLIEICRTKASLYNHCKGSIYLVFDFCEHDLAGMLRNVLVKFTLSEIKRVMQMLLNGLYYIHRNKILHRDMKPANELITRDGVLKLADFGLTHAFSLAKNSQLYRYTNRMVTVWYLPPELLLESGATAQPLTFGVLGASWQKCGFTALSCRVIQSSNSLPSSASSVAPSLQRCGQTYTSMSCLKSWNWSSARNGR